MTKALILNNIADARDCVSKELYREWDLFSTHPGVDVYLKEEHNIDCHCLSEFVSEEELFKYKSRVSEIVDTVLQELDTKIAPVLNKEFGVKMRYFVPLYSYFGKLHFSACYYFIMALKNVADKKKITHIGYYPYVFNNYYGFPTKVSGLIKGFISGAAILEMETSRKISAEAIFLSCAENGRRIYNLCKSGRLLKLFGNFSSGRHFDHQLKNILTDRLSYELSFLAKDLKDYNLVCCENLKNTPDFDRAEISPGFLKDLENGFFIRSSDEFEQLFLREVKEDFLDNLKGISGNIKNFIYNHKKFGFLAGIWDLPPVWGKNALEFEYLRSEGIKVLGVQHGSSYVDCSEPWHFNSDFDRCDFFISYGFDSSDLKRLYPDSKQKPAILPAGKIKKVENMVNRKKADIVFPLTIVNSIFAGGLIIAPLDQLAKRQIKLLEFFNSLSGLSVYVKLVPGANFENCAILPVLKRLRNLQVVDDITFADFLGKFNPRMVIIESSATPLYEAINLDTEIFLMNDIAHPYEPSALNELKKRVHYSENTDEMISLLDSFIKGGLPSKRDGSFSGHYVYRDNSKNKVIKAVKDICQNSLPVSFN